MSREKKSLKNAVQSTLFQEDSLANLSVLPGSEKAKMMTVTSGLKCFELFPKSNPLGCLVKMLLASKAVASTKCFLTWKISGTPRNRLLFQLALSTRRINGKGFGFLPTPQAQDRKCSMKIKFFSLVRILGGRPNPEFVEWLMGLPQGWTDLNCLETAKSFNASNGLEKR